jgi:hypothetical protein
MADTSVVAPMSDTETALLRAYVEGDVATLGRLGDKRQAMRSLGARGFVRETDRGMLVTPEGLAADLGGIMRTASRSAGSAAGSRGAPKRPSRAPRT